MESPEHSPHSLVLAPHSRTGQHARRSHRTILHSLSIGTALVISLTVARPAGACPDCAVGRQARAQLWTDGFSQNLLLALAPFLVIGALSVGANRIGK